MSIETLLEAAKFLELQAQQQQKAREDELKETLCVQQKKKELQQRCNVSYSSTPQVDHVSKAEQLLPQCRPGTMPPSLPPPPMSVSVIPFPVVTPNPAGVPTLPSATLSPPAAPPLASPDRDPQSPQEQSAVALFCSVQPQNDPSASVTTSSPQSLIQNHQLGTNSLQQQQLVPHSYPGAIVSPLKELPLLPRTSPMLQPAPQQNGPICRGSPSDDSRPLDSKKRPGGAGTREVHNKLEKNRRAHLKECFETLKKNIPNVDEKKTSNLSVLRSALRYIQTLKRKEKEYEHDMERLAREKIATQQRLAELKNQLSQSMDLGGVERVLRQAVQPEEDQASTSTASEGEDALDEDLDEATAQTHAALLPLPHIPIPEPILNASHTQAVPMMSHHVSFRPQSLPAAPTPSKPPTLAIGQLVPAALANKPPPPIPTVHPTVIARTSVSHPSVIQTVNHVIHAAGTKQVAQVAPAPPTTSVQLTPTQSPIGHITVHPVAHLTPHISALYPSSAVVGHLTSTLSHARPQLNGASSPQMAATVVGKQAAVSTQVMAHPPQLVGQTMLNPVTMVTMSPFPISTLKLA